MNEAIVVLLLSGVAIYFSSEFFVNGIEWLGRRMGVGDTATGSILAAIGTALPESVVTFVALGLADSPEDISVGIGAALGGPLALGTLGYAVVGAAMIAATRYARKKGLAAPKTGGDWRWLAHNQKWFLAVFAVKIGLGVVAFPHKAVAGLAFIAAYAWFFATEIGRGNQADAHLLHPLRLSPRAKTPSWFWVLVQVIGSAVVVFVASRLFVDRLGDVAVGLGLDPGDVALFLSPVATELPEAMNAIIWVRQGKQRLALANISGAMMIQATVPTAFGLLFSPWLLDHAELISAAATAAAMAALLMLFRAGRATGPALIQVAWFYVAFAAAVVWLT
jgi:cation:H+ antiporter